MSSRISSINYTIFKMEVESRERVVYAIWYGVLYQERVRDECAQYMPEYEPEYE